MSGNGKVWKKELQETTEAGETTYLGELDGDWPCAVLKLHRMDEPEIGDPIIVDVPGTDLQFRATWLGRVGNGKELAEAMRLMADMVAERTAANGGVDPLGEFIEDLID